VRNNTHNNQISEICTSIQCRSEQVTASEHPSTLFLCDRKLLDFEYVKAERMREGAGEVVLQSHSLPQIEQTQQPTQSCQIKYHRGAKLIAK
jgi:hypothetical protein